jgi:flagellar protein FlgJ
MTLPALPPSLGALGVAAGSRGGLGLPANDPQALSGLRARAAADPRAAVQEAARQFEALFMQELMKSLRQATPESGLMDNAGTRMGTELLDSQFALTMTGLPGGLSQAIARQLLRAMDAGRPEGDTGSAPDGLDVLVPRPLEAPGSPGSPVAPVARPVVPPVVDAPAVDAAAAGAAARRSPQALAFLQQHGQAARAVEAESGIPAAFMIGQAAHETGWGRREINLPDGRTSHNLFGIKAGPGWRGPVAEVTTTEYIDGQPRKLVQRFRAYASYEESFRDYARLLQGSPRYAGVMRDIATEGASIREFATGLQRAGYATDPAYADKLTRVINTTLRLQRALG